LRSFNKSMPEEIKEGAKATPIKGDGVWRWAIDNGFKDKKHLLVFKETKTSPLLDQNGNKAKFNIYTKSYLEGRRDKGTKPRNFLVDKKFLNRRGSDYLKTLGLDFPYSKPKQTHLETIFLSSVFLKYPFYRLFLAIISSTC